LRGAPPHQGKPANQILIGVFLAQAHLFDVDTMPEAIDLIPGRSIDGFANFETIAQWSIHANPSRSCMFARRAQS
jgi:hypothetical protein